MEQEIAHIVQRIGTGMGEPFRLSLAGEALASNRAGCWHLTRERTEPWESLRERIREESGFPIHGR